MYRLIRKVIRLKLEALKERYSNTTRRLSFRVYIKLNGTLNAISQEMHAQRIKLDVEQGYYTLVDKYRDSELALRELESQNRRLNQKINELGSTVLQLNNLVRELTDAKQN